MFILCDETCMLEGLAGCSSLVAFKREMLSLATAAGPHSDVNQWETRKANPRDVLRSSPGATRDGDCHARFNIPNTQDPIDPTI